MICRLCGGSADPLLVSRKPLRSYGRCSACGCVQVEETDLPCAEEEKNRYLLHENDEGDPGYRSWLLKFIDEGVLPFAAPPARVLDFGSGPVPLLGNTLAGLGYRVTLFDPFFAPSPAWEQETFELILLHEVYEHLAQPGATLEALLSRCQPGGHLCIRTKFLPRPIGQFDSWWYRSDSTHVGFMAAETIPYLARRFKLGTAYENGRDIVVFRKAPAAI